MTRTRLIFSPVTEIRRQRGFWVQLVGESATRRIVVMQALFPIAVWTNVAIFLVAIVAAIPDLAAGDGARARGLVMSALGCCVGVAIVGSALTRVFAASAARTLLPAITPLDSTATIENLITIIRSKPAYFAALSRKHPSLFPPA